MKSSASRTEFNKDESLKPINVSVIGLSGSCQIKGAVGVGKSSICNRLVRPDHFNQKQISTLSQVDFHSDIINGSSWIYWDNTVQTVDSKVYAFHVIEQTVLINDQTFLPFINETESDYISRAVSDKLVGSKRAYVSPSQFSRSQGYDTSSSIEQQSTIDAFILVFDVSEVNLRDYQAQDRYITKILTILQKAKKPIIIALSKFDIKSQKIKSRFESIIEKHNLKSIPIVETSANLNINISLIPSIVISEINHHHRSISLNLVKKPFKFKSFEEALSLKNKTKEENLMKFRHSINAEVLKTYVLSWETFSSNNDLSMFSNVIDRTELISEFWSCKNAMVDKINESLMSLYLVLFKKTLAECISALLTQEDSTSQNLLQNLLQNLHFLEHFQKENIDESTVFLADHLSKKIDYPLPRFLINVNNPLNQLHLIDSCIEEIKFQKIEINFRDEFLKRLESNPELYEDMMFGEVENSLKDMSMLSHFRELAGLIFSEFVSNRICQFKVLFDEKLLELSFMVFMCAPVKTCMKKCSLKEKDYKETLPDMGLINSINNKIYFDHKKFEKKIFRQQRTNWVVKYIGSLISSNPRECYHFDFCSAACHNNLLEYLHPFKVAVRDIVVAISCDGAIDECWKLSTDNKTIVFDDNFSSAVEYISFAELARGKPLNRIFSHCQKLIVLISNIGNNVDEIMERIFDKNFNYPDQLSFINVEGWPIDSDLQQMNLVVTRVDDQCNNIEDINCVDTTVMNAIKEQTISYICQREAICIWLIVLCDDTYDSNIPAILFLSLFDDCIVLEQHSDTSVASISIVYIPVGEDIPQRLNVTILSYHQAFKLLNDKCQDFTIHLLMYFCDINRLASINTLFAVLQNLLTVVSIKSVICSIKSSNSLDIDDLMNRIKMVKALAFDSRVLCVMIENMEGKNDGYRPDDEDIRQLRSIISEFVHLANYVDDNKNLCKYNTAYETEDVATITTRSELPKRRENTEYYKDKAVKCYLGKVCHHSSFESQERTLSQSDSLISPDITSSDPFFDQVDSGINISKIEIVDSEALGCFNEHLFCPIEEEDYFCGEVPDTSTIVQVNCTNIQHIGLEGKVKNVPSNQQSSKFRSFSGPAQLNKSSSRKYSSAQNQFNRSQRYSTKKSQSLTTSPVTSYMKSCSQSQAMLCNCKGSNEHCLSCPAAAVHNTANTASKSFKNAFSRLFSSDRCSNKSAEERRGLFRRSIKFTKKNTDKKVKITPTTNSLSDGLFNRYTHPIIAPPSHSMSVSIADSRNRTKSLSKTVFSL